MCRRTVSTRPIAIEKMLASASIGQALPVFGSFLAAGAPEPDPAAAGAGAAPDVERDAAGAPAPPVPAAPAPEAGAALARVASTCCWVRTFGGCDVTIVAVKRSPEWKSENLAGAPSFMILMPRFSTS